MKYMLIMRAVDQRAVEDFESADFNEVIAAMGAYNASMVDAGVLADGADSPMPRKDPSSISPTTIPSSPTAPTANCVNSSTASGSSTSQPRRRRSSGPSAHRSDPAPNWRSAASTTSTTSRRTTSGSRKNRNGSTRAS